MYLAASDDGLKWRVLHGNRPLRQPRVGENKLMRDPSIVRTPDGTFHRAWTTSWQGPTLGLCFGEGRRSQQEQECEAQAFECNESVL